MYGKPYWYGKEVEGRFSDILTVFVRETIPSDYNEYPHIYFTIEYIKKCIEYNSWNRIENIVHQTKMLVTIEANSETLKDIPTSIFNLIHIIYRIIDPNLEKLKKYDTLSIDTEWYNTYQITKQHMLHTTNDDYKFDIK